MTYEILSTPVNSPASLLFKQCLAEINTENRLLNSAINEVGGYFLNRSEEAPLSNNLWDKVLDQTRNVKSPSKTGDEYDPFYLCFYNIDLIFLDFDKDMFVYYSAVIMSFLGAVNEL